MTSDSSNYNSKRKLIITYHYSPEIDPRAFRWAAVAEYWGTKGYEIDVVSVWEPGLPNSEVLNKVNVYRVRDNLAILKSFIKNREGNKSPRYDWSKIPNKPLARLSPRVIYENSLKKLQWPDFSFLWYFSALKKAQELIRTAEYDGIISVSVPFTGHLVGLSLKKKFPQIPWLVDIGDPFSWLDSSPPNNLTLYKSLNYSVEGEVFEYADAITVTTKLTQEKYIQFFPKLTKKIQVIPPLASPSLVCKNINWFFSLPEKIRFVFIGSLYKDTRDPDFLLRLFKRLQQTHVRDKLELHFFGRMNDYLEQVEEYRPLLNSKIFIHGLVTHSESKQVMQEADILVNIGNENPSQLPSKVVEYISTGKPVLNLAKINEDSSAEFFSQYPAALSLFDSEEAFSSDTLHQLIQFIEHPPQVDEETLERLCKPFQVEAIATAYEVIFQRLSS